MGHSIWGATPKSGLPTNSPSTPATPSPKRSSTGAPRTGCAGAGHGIGPGMWRARLAATATSWGQARSVCDLRGTQSSLMVETTTQAPLISDEEFLADERYV